MNSAAHDPILDESSDSDVVNKVSKFRRLPLSRRQDNIIRAKENLVR